MTPILPQVSVVLPVHNRAHLLPRSVGSVLRQSVQDLEVLVVDDGSSDDVAGVLTGMQDARVRHLRTQGRQGAPAARNLGIAHARGPVLALLDSDDEWLPTRLERQLPLATDAGLIVCGFEVRHPRRVLTVAPGALRGPSFERLLGLRGGPLTCSVFMLRTDLARAIGGFDEHLPALQDLDFALRIARQGHPLLGTREVLVVKHSDHGGDRIFSGDRRLVAREMILAKYAAELRRRPACQARQQLALARAQSESGNLPAARQLVSEAHATAPGVRTALERLAIRHGPRAHVLMSKLADSVARRWAR